MLKTFQAANLKAGANSQASILAIGVVPVSPACVIVHLLLSPVGVLGAVTVFKHQTASYSVA